MGPILSIMGDFFEHCSKAYNSKNLSIIGWGLIPYILQESFKPPIPYIFDLQESFKPPILYILQESFKPPIPYILQESLKPPIP